MLQDRVPECERCARCARNAARAQLHNASLSPVTPAIVPQARASSAAARYPIKRGHYRVRVCWQLALWANSHLLQDDWREHLREMSREFPTLNAVINKQSLEAKLDPAFSLLLDGPLCNVPVAFLPTNFFEQAVLYAERLRIGEIVNRLSKLPTSRRLKAKSRDGNTTTEFWEQSRPRKIKVADVIRAMGLKRATFYWREYHKIVKEFCPKLEPEDTKDPRAKKLSPRSLIS